MPIILDQQLYNSIKREADKVYDKPSAYKSMYIVKTYKQRGGEYGEDGQERNLDRWRKEKWKDIGGLEYPVYRPTKRINKKTPLTPDEIDPENLLQQIFLKQKIKGESNLPKFEGKGLDSSFEKELTENKGGVVGELLVPYKIKPYSYKQAKRLGVKIEPSKNPKKKIDVFDWNNQFICSIGAKGYSDYPTYLAEKGKEYADNRRRLYKIRHSKDRSKLGSPGYYSDQILW